MLFTYLQLFRWFYCVLCFLDVFHLFVCKHTPDIYVSSNLIDLLTQYNSIDESFNTSSIYHNDAINC